MKKESNGEFMERYTFPAEKRCALESLRQPFAVYQIIDKRVVALLVSDGFLDLFGYTDRALAIRDMNNNMYKDVHPDDVARIANAALRFAAEGGKYEVVYRSKKKEGSDYDVVHATGEHVYTEDGCRLAQVWYTDEGIFAEDSAEAGIEIGKSLNDVLQEQSILNEIRYDILTGLPSMTYFFELADAGKPVLMRDGENPAFLYFDMSGMKFYNRKYGFAGGDKMIRAFARLLTKTFSNENCCHIGGDHFAVYTGATGLEDVLGRLFEEWHEIHTGSELPVRTGIYLNSMGECSAVTACDRAKFACDSISNSYISQFGYYKKELQEDLEKRQYVLSNIDRALENGWIQVYYQPIVRAVSGKVCDEEALARWIDPEKGFLSPADFIPYLEEAGQIYKLDLYVLDQVLNKIQTIRENGLYIVPQSINLSRSDFYACDIVEEVCKRVDNAGVSHDLITIEITESIIGGDVDFIKSQSERFQKLGFPVWMDDFGSGYSSMDILQTVRFNLIKFDMGFMKRLDEGDEGKIILTELMKMATALGVDTVCEGVETEEQVRFLQTIGCSKLQGYYYLKPVPLATILERYEQGTQIGFEDPRESSYFDGMGRINLYDLSFMANKDENDLRNTFDTLPMGIIEINPEGDAIQYVRYNDSFRDFINRTFDYDMTAGTADYAVPTEGPGSVFMRKLEQCRSNGDRVFIEEKHPDGTIVHSFARRIGVNPVTGKAAIAVAILSVTDPDEGTTYAAIARALAADYYSLFYVDLTSGDYIEYSSSAGDEEIAVEEHGKEFFKTARDKSLTVIYKKDQEIFLKNFTRENIIRELKEQGSFMMTYRLMEAGKPVYARMKIMPMEQDYDHIIIGVSIIDAQMKQQEEENRLRQERLSLGRVAALSTNYIVLYTVDPVTDNYTQYNPSNEFASFGLASQGEDFFKDVVIDAPKAIAPGDIENHLRVFTKENMLKQIHENGYFIHRYRLLMDGKLVPVSLKATLVKEDDGEKILLGVTFDDKEEHRSKSEEAYGMADSSCLIYKHIAQALARGYTDLYYVNMETDELIEYHTDDAYGVLSEVRRSADFFEGCRRDVKLFVHQDDQEAFVNAMDQDFLTKTLEQSKVFEMTYRRIKNGKAFYVSMKVSRVEDDKRFIVIAVSDIDELVRKRRAEERMLEERVIYARLHALTGNFIVVYVVDPETNHYREFSATDDYVERFAQAKEGEDFFNKVRDVAREYNHPGDLPHFLSVFTKENIMEEIERSGIFTFGYRLMMKGKPIYVQMKAAMVEEKEGLRLIVGLTDIDIQVRQEEEYIKRLAMAQSQVSIDALTGVKNKHAYLELETRMDRQIAERRISPFAIVMFDVNDLKMINDTIGHQAGDQYLRDACSIICDIFKRSPVYRVGGDEFAVIVQGKDYDSIEELLGQVNGHNIKAIKTGGIVIACGMAKYENDTCVATVFDRADHNMYENKKYLKR